MSDGFGLNKEAALAAEREARADAEREAPEVVLLNPAWPWEVVSFDAVFWRLDPDPPLLPAD